ncbi:MAG: N-acetylmuramoyl-L-alanine amidase [Spirochaetota bacterium]|nr:N-acetylmuramoyl-L-alanine amidase [Spirochaetota bacterium]
MKLKLYIHILLFLFIITYSTLTANSSDNTTNSYGYRFQPEVINSILQKETSIKNQKILMEILNQIDDIYGDLYLNLLKGDKITIFFDPAHGKLADGRWEGEATGRISCTGLTEEMYSIMISRKLYKYLSDNRYLDIKSTNDFLGVMKEESDVYKNIRFSETVKTANKEKAFMIISVHLNNISSLFKASGQVDMPGIHITHGENGYKYLTYKRSSHHGFLTLYNKYDVTGFSKKYASKLKKRLISHGLKPNTWEFGTVADDRFSYFVDFPISLIFECGFISNPKDEARLRNPEYQEKIAESQYKAFLESVREIFGIDISGKKIKKINDISTDKITLLKLSRIAIFYIQNCDTQKAVSTIKVIERKYNRSKYRELVKPYKKIKGCLIKAEKYYKRGKRLIKAKKHGVRYLKKAIRLFRERPIFVSYNEEYANIINNLLKGEDSKTSKKGRQGNIVTSLDINKASRTTPIILAIEKKQSLREAIQKALSPSPQVEKKLLKSFRNSYRYKRVKVKKYSKKKKRYVYYWKWKKKRTKFTIGIYVLKLKKNLVVKSVKRVSQIALNPLRYQNHQYMKNSYFAFQEKHKSL